MPESSNSHTDSGPMPEHHLQDVFNNAPIGVFTSTPEGRYISANPALAEMFGYESPEELIASITDITTQVYVDRADHEAFMRLMTEHGKAVEHECRFKRRDGTEFWVSRNVRAIRDEDGRVVAYQGFITDITERKQAEEALRGSEERYRNVAEANAGIVWDVDANLFVTHVSGRVYEILGYEPEEIIGRSPISLIDPEDRERISAIMARMLRQQEPVKDIEYWCRHSSGGRVRILTNGIAFFAQDGGFLGFRGTHIDITETYWARRCQKITLRLHEMINDSDNAISAVLCEACSEVTDSPMAFFGMLEPDESAMIAHVWSPAAMAECGIADKPLRFPIETAGLWAQPIRRREPVICNNYPDALEKQGLPEGHVPITRYLGVPILHGDKVVAMAGAANRAPGYEERHIDRLRMITSTIADILLLRRNEAALRDQSQLLQNIIDTAADLLSVTDLEGNFKFVGPSHGILGYDPVSLVGRNVMELVHPDDYRETATAFADFMANREDGRKAEYRYRRADGDYLWFETIGKFILDNAGNPKEILFNTRNITARKQAEGQLKRIEWMLSRKPVSNIEARTETHDQGYGDLTELNLDGIILKSIGHERLKSFANDYLELLDTSSAIYEANGDYAFGIFASGWCRMMDRASRNLCDTPDNAEALDSGRWLCHESCWTDCSKQAIAKGTPVDIGCSGGIRLYAVPIFAGGKVIGAINFGYGDPPKDPEKLKVLADAYHLDHDDLLSSAAAYDSRPPYIIETAKKRLSGTAKLIGSMVETKQAMEALEASEATIRNKLKAITAPDGDIGTLDLGDIIDTQELQTMMEDFYKITGIGGAILDISGKVLVGVAWTDICAKFHRVHPDTAKNCLESDLALAKGVPAGTFKAYRCKNNMWDMVSPIQIGGKHLGNIYIGQFFYKDERVDYELFRKQARRYGFDETEYLAALDRVPRLKRETVESAMTFYAKLAGMISSLSYSKIKLSRDIALRKQAEKALRESETRFQKMLGVVPDMISIQNPEMDILYSNWQGFAAVPSNRRILHTKCHKTYRKFDSICPDCLATSVLENRTPVHEETRLPDGKWYDIRVIPILDKDNNVEMFMEWVRDITESKQAEEALRESEEKHRRLFETMAQGVVYHAADGTILSANPAAERILGLSFDQIRGRLSMDSRWGIIDEDGTEVPGMDYPSMIPLRTGKTFGPAIRGVFHPDKNTHVWVSITAIPLFQPGETKPFQVYTTFEDITDRKKAEAEREKLQEQLTQAQKMESVGRLAGGVAHDFNNMLGVILGHAEMAMDQVEPAQPLFSDIEEIRKAAERSAILTRQLLTFARKQTIAPKVIDLNETVEGMLQMLRRLIGEDIHLAWRPGRNLPSTKMDPSQIDQILANLCVNARDAIRGVGKITIETGEAAFDEAYCAEHAGFKPGEYVLLAVSDNGCGMDKETISHLFEPFFTTKEVGKGTGLGLATVYGAVKQNNGFINVYSEPGQGTTFRIYLPPYQAGTRVRPDTATAKTAACGSETILLVEDEPAILRMATMMLERLGYAVITAQTPGEAIRLAREHSGPIDLLMTDVVMPEMNGRDLAKNLLSIYPAIKRLFMSGYTANVIAHHGVLDEGVHFIQKPFSSKDLGAKLRDVLEG